MNQVDLNIFLKKAKKIMFKIKYSSKQERQGLIKKILKTCQGQMFWDCYQTSLLTFYLKLPEFTAFVK